MVRWRGILAATITPFREDGTINYEALSQHVDRLVDAGCAAIVANAVSAEGGSLTPQERADTVRCIREAVGKRAAVIASAGSVGDYETIADIRNAAKAGADGLMIISPYFYRLTQTERVEYFCRMGAIGGLPYIVYNTTYASPMVSADELVALAEKSELFSGVKEGDHTQASEVARRLAPSVAVYTSRDSYICELGFAGGCGAVTYSSNIVPELTVALWNAIESGDHATALKLQRKLNPIALGLVTRSFPSPLKAAMHMVGWDEGHLRLPLTRLNPDEQQRLWTILKELDPHLADAA